MAKEITVIVFMIGTDSLNINSNSNELCFSAGLMKFLRLLKFVYLFFHSRSAGEGKYLTGFRYFWFINE